MATDFRHLPPARLAPAVPKGAQCPNCFTFNLLHHLPESRKQQSASGVQVTCALCGTTYAAGRQPPRAA